MYTNLWHIIMTYGTTSYNYHYTTTTTTTATTTATTMVQIRIVYETDSFSRRTFFYFGVDVDRAQPELLVLVQHSSGGAPVQSPVRLEGSVTAPRQQHGRRACGRSHTAAQQAEYHIG